MTTISTLGSTPLSSNLSSDSVSRNESLENNNTASTTTEASSSETVALSTRAQNIQKLNEEFFSKGFSEFQVTETFLTRLIEYGLISDSDAKALSSTIAADDETETTKLGSLTGKVQSLIEVLTEADANNELIEPLQTALDVIKNLDSPQNKPTAAEIIEVQSELAYQQADNATLSDEAVNTLDQLDLMLSIAGKLTPSTLNSSAINSYLSHIV